MNYNLHYDFIFSVVKTVVRKWISTARPISPVHTGTRLQDRLLEYLEIIPAIDCIYVLRPQYYENMSIRR